MHGRSNLRSVSALGGMTSSVSCLVTVTAAFVFRFLSTEHEFFLCLHLWEMKVYLAVWPLVTRIKSSTSV